MNEINKIYQAHMSHELKLVVDPNHAVLNKDKVEAKVLAFLCELGKVGEEAKVFSFWDNSSANNKEILNYYTDALHMLMSIGFELHVDKLKNYQEINKLYEEERNSHYDDIINKIQDSSGHFFEKESPASE